MQMSETVFVGLISAACLLFGVIVGAVSPWIREAGNNKRQARYLAVRIVCILDEFVDECTSVVGDDGLCFGQNNAEGCLEAQVSQPKTLPLPSDVDWRTIDHHLTYRILALPSRIERDNRAISFAAEHSFPPDYREFFEERQYRYACLGLDVATLTQTLRSAYRIPAQDADKWDPVAYLSEEKSRLRGVGRSATNSPRSCSGVSSSVTYRRVSHCDDLVGECLLALPVLWGLKTVGDEFSGSLTVYRVDLSGPLRFERTATQKPFYPTDGLRAPGLLQSFGPFAAAMSSGCPPARGRVRGPRPWTALGYRSVPLATPALDRPRGRRQGSYAPNCCIGR